MASSKAKRLLFLLLLLAGHASSARAGDCGKLSGSWVGDMKVLRRLQGGCELRNPKTWRLQIDAKGDGSVRLGLTPRSAEPLGELPWKTDCIDDDVLQWAVPKQATCKGEPRAYETAFVGKLLSEKGRTWFEVRTDDPICPNMGCWFKQVYKLKRE
jgi:hypothetical protein